MTNMINKRISVCYFTLLLMQLTQIKVSAQEPLSNPIKSYYKNISDKRLKELRIVKFNPEDSIKELHAIHWYGRNGKIKKSRIFDEIFPSLETFIIYHHDPDGLSETTIVNGKFQNQQINLLYEGINIKVFRSDHVDTTKSLFKNIKVLSQNILDTVKLEEAEKISSLIISDKKNDHLRVSYTKAFLKDGRVYQEITKGYEQDSVVWSYHDEELTKTYYIKERKFKSIKFSKQGLPVFEELSGTFNVTIENAYTSEGKIMTTWWTGSIEKRLKYVYSNDLLTMIEEYASQSDKTIILKFDYLFNNNKVSTH